MMKFTLFFCLFLLACNSEVAAPNVLTEAVFFDLPSYFQTELNTIEQRVIALEKTATVNGETEKKRLEDFDLEKELSIFINADINRTTWKDQYQVDSVLNNNQQLTTIQYTALNDNLKTKVLMISFDKGVVSEIEIVKGLDNIAVQSNQRLTYFPNKGYRIINEQSTILSDSQKVKVEVRYDWKGK